MRATSRTIVRAWNKDHYHKDILVLDSEQVRMYDSGVKTRGSKVSAGNCGAVGMLIDPKDFPDVIGFEILVEEYKT